VRRGESGLFFLDEYVTSLNFMGVTKMVFIVLLCSIIVAAIYWAGISVVWSDHFGLWNALEEARYSMHKQQEENGPKYQFKKSKFNSPQMAERFLPQIFEKYAPTMDTNDLVYNITKRSPNAVAYNDERAAIQLETLKAYQDYDKVVYARKRWQNGSVIDISRVSAAPIAQLADLKNNVNDDINISLDEKQMLMADINNLSSHIESHRNKLVNYYSRT